MDLDIDGARGVLAAQSFSVLLGTRLTIFGEGRSELVVPVNDDLKQQHGFVHGGVVSYLADLGLAFAAGSVLGDVLTAEFKLNLMRPARGDAIVARGHVLHAGKRQATCRCDVFARDGAEEVLCAVALGTVVKVGGAGAA